MKKPIKFLTHWMLTPVELIGVLGLIILAASGFYFSIKDALQLGETINLSLTQTVILNQGVVNLQREVQLTRLEVTRMLGGLDDPPKGITRYDFAKIQINNLVAEVEQPSIRFSYTAEDIELVEELKMQDILIGEFVANLASDSTDLAKQKTLEELDAELALMETTVKKLIDRQSSSQRNAIIQTRDSLYVSQRTDIIAGIVLVLMSISLAALVRRTLSLRLQQALEADRIKSQLFRNLSHELRTPLAAITGYAELLNEGAYGPVTAEQKETINKVMINTTQLQWMVNNLLDSAQIEQGKLSIKYSDFNLAELIDTTYNALEILAKTKNLELTKSVDANLPASITSDKLRLQQILFNLTSNALKFTEKGAVTIRVYKYNEAHWALQVTDTGIGMSAEAQMHMFEPFWQADNSATRQYRGSGLGLAIVKQLTDLLHGRIEVKSEAGNGTTLTVILPLEPKQ